MDAVRPTFHSRLTIEIPAEAELYEKLKAYQWNASTEIDWSRPIQNYSEESYAAVRQHFGREDYDRLRAQQRAFTFTQLFLGEQAALALCAQLLNMVPEMETKLCLSGQIIDEARHVEVFGRYLEKLGVEAPLNPALEDLVHRLLESDHYGEKIVGMQIFLEGVAVGLFQRFQKDSPDPLMRDLIQLVLRDESRHAGFGVIYLGDKFRGVSAAERRRVEDFVAELWRLFHHATASPFGPVNEFLSATFTDIAHRLKLIGLELRD
ncbi:MAG: ferritin-like domain-containing protein [Deltaproteobacteria bacterium]|nr:ferritin-like domain-containing protein [Deltaproteobacteria bacterium]